MNKKQKEEQEAQISAWRTQIAECQNSGMSISAWCAARGINPKTYGNWKKRIAEADKEAGSRMGSENAKLVVAEEERKEQINFVKVMTPGEEASSDVKIEMKLKNSEVIIHGKAGAELAAAIIEAMKLC